MFDIGWVEMMVIVVVMIIVIGPKDLPYVLHTLGRWVAQVRAVARNFQDSLEEMAEETGINKVRDEITAASRFDPGKEIEKAIDPDHSISESMRDLSETPRRLTEGAAGARAEEEEPRADGEEKPAKETAGAPGEPARGGDKT